MKRLFILIPIMAALLSSCYGLNTSPLSQVTPDAFFNTESDLQLFSNSFYNNLLDKSPYDIQSDVMVHQTLSDPMYGGSYRSVPTTSSTYWDWNDVRKASTLIEYADQCEDKAAVAKYTAVARFFIAFDYFTKVKYVGDVPWIDYQVFSDDPILYAPRDTREYVMTKMIECVDYAIENLGEDDNVYRVDKWAALALKAQFCLFEGTFRKYHGISYEEHDYTYYLQLAVDAADEIITNGPFKLYSTGNPDQDYLMLFGEEDANTDEWIFGIKFDYSLGIYHSASYWATTTGGNRPGFTRKFVNTYLMKDGTAFTDKTDWATMGFVEECQDRDPRMAQTMRTQGYTRINHNDLCTPTFGATCTGYQVVKFVQDPDESGGNADRSGRGTNDMPVYRLAEVYLNYAEAKAELGTLTQDDLDRSVNLLRDRVDMPHIDMAKANASPDWYLSSEDYGYPNVTGANQGVILEIRRERTIELVCEGFRWWDLMRWKCGPCKDQSLCGMYFPGLGEYDLDGDGVVDTVIYSGTNEYASNVTNVYQVNVDENFLQADEGYYMYHHLNQTIYPFDEERDYLYPVPSKERELNPNLTQNPGWNDGLNY